MRLDALLAFERLGHVKTPGLLSADAMRSAKTEIDRLYAESELNAYQQKVRVLLGEDALQQLPTVAAMHEELARLPDGSVPFLQLFNLWRSSPKLLGLLSSKVHCADRMLQTSALVSLLLFHFCCSSTAKVASDAAPSPIRANARPVLNEAAPPSELAPAHLCGQCPPTAPVLCLSFAFCFLQELAGTAADLLGLSSGERLRLYQDSLFVKRSGDGVTNWHTDLAMAPLDTNRFVTVWLPLQPVASSDEGGTALIFASGSHRDVALPFWHGDPRSQPDLDGRGYVEGEAGAFRLGDANWHHGWTLHCAPGNELRATRRALAASYFVDGATRLAVAKSRGAPDDEDCESYSEWLKEASRPAFAP